MEERFITYKSGKNATHIDFIMLKSGNVTEVDYKRIPGEVFNTTKIICSDYLIKDTRKPRKRRSDKT